MKAAKVIVNGKVQGVFFRYYTKVTADRLGLAGTVENQPDGSVLIRVMGEEDKLSEFILWCHEGSPVSKVESVKILPWEGEKSLSQFNIIR